jgi:hypothetical protein
MSSTSSTPKVEYKVAVDDEKVTDPLLAETIQVMRTPTTMDRIMNHPALPVASYCVASIMMTVVNKVRSLLRGGRSATVGQGLFRPQPQR